MRAEKSIRVRAACLFALLLTWVWAGARERGEVVRPGAGSYRVGLPAGVKGPPSTIYRTSRCRGPMPTNDWWSSVAWMEFSERQYPHPLAVRAEKRGLRVHYPGPGIHANRSAIFGFMPGGGDDDIVIGHSAEDAFPDARVDGWSDWFVRVRWARGPAAMTASYGHGSPYVFVRYEGGQPRLTLGRGAKVWLGDARSAAVGVSIGKRHYGLFAPTGARWEGLGTKTLTCRTRGTDYFTLALLPEATPAAMKLFGRYAHAHVTDTKVTWRYDAKRSAVVTTFAVTTAACEPGAPKGTLLALYPHQWRHTKAKLTGYTYASVRGEMKLVAGSSFTTEHPFTGVLPALPDAGGCDRKELARLVRAEADAKAPPLKDTYWEGKYLGRLATVIPLAEQCGQAAAADAIRDRLRRRLERWLTAAEAGGAVRTSHVFCYEKTWGTLIGVPASYGSSDQLNDHHFHYGYFLKGAAEVARRDPAWAGAKRFGPMLDALTRDVACPRRDDKLFPFLRNFDPYAGHSWAAGHAKFGDGNNNESSSEAMNAWTALVLLGEATGERALRDLGIYLYATEMSAVQEYWFDLRDANHPASYTPSVVTMIWGGKGANGTWFTANPEMVHGINFLPVHGGSLYLGHSPAYVRKNYAALVAENKGTHWDAWADVIWMYLALADPDEAIRQYQASGGKYPAEAGTAPANLYHWLYQLRALGQVDATVTADCPLYAVFRKGRVRTYVVYSMQDRPRTVRFSDGRVVKTRGKGFAMD